MEGKKAISESTVNNHRIGITLKLETTKYELLLVFCFVVVVLFLSPFVSVLVIGLADIMQSYQSF